MDSARRSSSDLHQNLLDYSFIVEAQQYDKFVFWGNQLYVKKLKWRR